jgi:hypothetical protein
MTEEHTTSYLTSSDIVEKQSLLKIRIILSAHLIVQELNSLIMISPPYATEATCGLPAFPHTKLKKSEASMDELLQRS